MIVNGLLITMTIYLFTRKTRLYGGQIYFHVAMNPKQDIKILTMIQEDHGKRLTLLAQGAHLQHIRLLHQMEKCFILQTVSIGSHLKKTVKSFCRKIDYGLAQTAIISLQ